jgi:hypothetical protein
MEIYKRITKDQLHNRVITIPTEGVKSKVRTTILNFKNYFKLKHLG